MSNIIKRDDLNTDTFYTDLVRVTESSILNAAIATSSNSVIVESSQASISDSLLIDTAAMTGSATAVSTASQMEMSGMNMFSSNMTSATFFPSIETTALASSFQTQSISTIASSSSENAAADQNFSKKRTMVYGLLSLSFVFSMI